MSKRALFFIKSFLEKKAKIHMPKEGYKKSFQCNVIWFKFNIREK